VELDERAVFVEDEQVDPVEEVAYRRTAQTCVAGCAGSLTYPPGTLAHLLAIAFV
jgi:hypothetical protein